MKLPKDELQTLNDAWDICEKIKKNEKCDEITRETAERCMDDLLALVESLGGTS